MSTRQTRNFKMALLLISFLLLVLISCKKSTNPSEGENNGQGQIVTTNVTEIAPFEEISGFQKGTKMKIRLNREGFTVREHEITFEVAFIENDENVFICQVTNDLLIGGDDAGAPVFTTDNRVAGALYRTFSGNNPKILVKSIDDLLQLSNIGNNGLSKAVSVSDNSNLSNSNPVRFISGCDETYMQNYSKRKGINNSTNYVYISDENFNKQNFHKQIAILADDTLMIQGVTIAVMYTMGDLINEYDLITLSYINEYRELFSCGDSYYDLIAPPCFMADMKTVIEYYDEYIFKIAMPTKKPVGTLIKHRINGILIDENANPITISINTSIDIDSTGVNSYSHYVSTSNDKWNNYFEIMRALIYPVKKDMDTAGINTAVAEVTCKIELDEMDIETMNTGWREARINQSVLRDSLLIAGQKYERGVGTHATSTYLINLSGKGSLFSAKVGVDDNTGENASVIFHIVGDKTTLWESPLMKKGDPATVLKNPFFIITSKTINHFIVNYIYHNSFSIFHCIYTKMAINPRCDIYTNFIVMDHDNRRKKSYI